MPKIEDTDEHAINAHVAPLSVIQAGKGATFFVDGHRQHGVRGESKCRCGGDGANGDASGVANLSNRCRRMGSTWLLRSGTTTPMLGRLLR
jgi:hypothetical protein